MAIKLTERQSKILIAQELRADVAAETIARKVGAKAHTVRRELRLMKDKDIIREIAVVNPATFGYQTFDVSFSTGSASSIKRHEFIADLLNSGVVTIVVEHGGEYEYRVSILAKNAQDVFKLFAALEKKHGLFLTEKSIAISLTFWGLGRKYLAPGIKPGFYEERRYAERTISLDETDHRILSALATERYDSHAEIARRIKLQKNTFNHRLKRLKEKGVITSLVYAVDGSRFGKSVYSFHVATKTMEESFRKSFVQYCKAQPNIINATEFLGPWDFKLNVEVATPEEVPPIRAALKQKFGNKLQRVLVSSALKVHKVKTYPFKKPPC